MIKYLIKLGIEENVLNVIKHTQQKKKKALANIICNGEMLKGFPLDLRMGQEYLLSPLGFDIVAEVPASEIGKKKIKI